MGTTEKLHVFTDRESEYVTAYSAEDAMRLYCELNDYEPGSGTDDDRDCGTRITDWELVPDEQAITLGHECREQRESHDNCPAGCDENLEVWTTKTAAEWAAGGRRHFASENW